MSFEAVGGLDTYSLEDARLSFCRHFTVEEKDPITTSGVSR